VNSSSGTTVNQTITITPPNPTFNNTINVTGANGYARALGSISTCYGGYVNINAISANVSLASVGISSAAGPFALNASGGNIAVTGTVESGAISGNGNLVQTGASTIVLSGSNSYTGSTTISAGELLVNGLLAACSAVSVASGAFLAGTGTVNGQVTIATGAGGGGTLNLTASPVGICWRTGTTPSTAEGRTPNRGLVLLLAM